MAVLFCVGLNRTGTTTLGDACAILGMRRLGWVRSGGGQGSHFLLKDWWRGDIDHLIEVASGFDTLEDLPWPLVYAEMSTAFPDARFVLTRRRSTDVWLRSQINHVAEKGRYGMHRRIYGSSDPTADPQLYRAYYERHNDDVRTFFAGTDRLLEVCWEEKDGWPELCGFLGVPVPDVAFPHSNPTGWTPPPPPPSRLKRAVNRGVSSIRRT
jgi:hypothetical protein